jgi:hypothetical protein
MAAEGGAARVAGEAGVRNWARRRPLNRRRERWLAGPGLQTCGGRTRLVPESETERRREVVADERAPLVSDRGGDGARTMLTGPEAGWAGLKARATRGRGKA